MLTDSRCFVSVKHLIKVPRQGQGHGEDRSNTRAGSAALWESVKIYGDSMVSAMSMEDLSA
jgi:hypothetical protein